MMDNLGVGQEQNYTFMGAVTAAHALVKSAREDLQTVYANYWNGLICDDKPSEDVVKDQCESEARKVCGVLSQAITDDPILAEPVIHELVSTIGDGAVCNYINSNDPDILRIVASCSGELAGRIKHGLLERQKIVGERNQVLTELLCGPDIESASPIEPRKIKLFVPAKKLAA